MTMPKPNKEQVFNELLACLEDYSKIDLTGYAILRSLVKDVAQEITIIQLCEEYNVKRGDK